jgi:cell wall-associated NlpC family hydrolase
MSVAVPAIEIARRSRAAKLIPGILALLVLVIVAPLVVISTSSDSSDFSGGGLPAGAQPFVAVYQDAGRAFGVSPFLLMAVHEDETNYSTATLPGVQTGLNFAGCCAGPMQFSIAGAASNTAGGSGGTWGGYAKAYKKARVERPARYPGRYDAVHPNVYDSYDAIYAAADYFRSLGARPQLDTHTLDALASYKGTPPASLPFARHDYRRAQELQSLAAASTDSGANAALGDVDGTPLQRVIAYANKIEALRLPYCWGGGHAPKPGPSTGSYCHAADHSIVYGTTDNGLDCSGSTRWLLTLAGFRDPGGIGSGDFASAYDSGPGKHITIWSNAEHVFVTIDGHSWTTSQDNYRNGPGWAEHTTVGFVASHPHGL